MALATILQVGNVDEIASRFYDFFPRDKALGSNEIPFVLNDFIEQVLVPCHSPIVNVLKCMNQGILVPAVSILKFLFFASEVNYFEIRGKWKIDIEEFHDKILVSHKRWERSDPEGFNFKWELGFILGKEDAQLINTNLNITKIRYTSDEVTDDLKGQLLELIKDIYKPSDE